MTVNQVCSSVVVRRPVDEVWDVIADASQFEQWCELFWFESAPFEEGQKRALIIPVGPFKARVPVEVVTFNDETRELRWDASFGGIHGSHWLRVSELVGEQTLIVHGEDFKGLRWIWPHIRTDVHAEYQKAVEALGRYVEA